MTATDAIVIAIWFFTGGLCWYMGFWFGQRTERIKQDHLRRVTKQPTTDRIVTSGSSQPGVHAVVHKAHVRRGRISKGQ